MFIGFLNLEIYIPYSHSLKEKRKCIKSIRDRIQKKYNVAIAELDYQDKWQRIKIGIVTLNSHKIVVERLLNKVILDIEENIEGEIIAKQIHFF